MVSVQPLCFAILVIGLVATASTTAVLEKADCLELGFTGDQLCSECDTLAGYVKDEELVNDCKKCCAKGLTDEVTRYSSAVLEVCPYRLNGLPQIKDFIDKKSKSYKALRVRQKYGAYPTLILKSKSSDNSLRIDNWKASHIEEYLNDRLAAKPKQ